MTRQQQHTVNRARIQWGMLEEDVIVIDDRHDNVEVMMGSMKGRPKLLVVEPSGEVLDFMPLDTEVF